MGVKGGELSAKYPPYPLKRMSFKNKVTKTPFFKKVKNFSYWHLMKNAMRFTTHAFENKTISFL
ncbi:hypothetical protein HpDR82_10840 [Helicobacter pylori]